MAWSVPAIRDGIRDRLETIDGLRGYDTMSTVLNVPAAVVVPDDPMVTYNEAMGPVTALLHFNVVVLVSKSSDRAAQDALDAYLAPSGVSSVKAAVEGTLGGTADDAQVTTASRYGVYVVGAVEYLGIQFGVEVLV